MLGPPRNTLLGHVHFPTRVLLPIAIAYCYCLLLLPIAGCLLLLPIATAYCYCPLLLPIAIAYCYCLLLLPIVIARCYFLKPKNAIADRYTYMHTHATITVIGVIWKTPERGL